MNKNVFTVDDIDRGGFINQNIILEYITEEEIFELVFGFQPEEYVYVTSPFRNDRNPGCWFERASSYTGKLRFIDYANSKINKPMDCFDAIQQYFKISNFYLTLEYVYNRLIKNKNVVAEKRIQHVIQKKEVILNFDSRPFSKKDGLFWENRYEITKENLIEDKVFAINKYHLSNSKNGDFSSRCYDICYGYTDFNNNRKKLYFPYRENKKRFISTCTKNDIGGLNKLPPFGNQLIITKSYKDWRVLINNGKYAIWFQNEGMIPDSTILIPIIKRFNKVIVWFDNDAQGIGSSQKISNLINSYFPNKCNSLWLPEKLNVIGISDPSDLLHKKGKKALEDFLIKFI